MKVPHRRGRGAFIFSLLLQYDLRAQPLRLGGGGGLRAVVECYSIGKAVIMAPVVLPTAATASLE